MCVCVCVWGGGEGEARHENFMCVQIILNALAGYNKRHKDEVHACRHQ